MNAAQRAVVDAVAQVTHERNAARKLLAEVYAGHTQTSRDDVVLVQIPADVFEQIRELAFADSNAAIDQLRERLDPRAAAYREAISRDLLTPDEARERLRRRT